MKFRMVAFLLFFGAPSSEAFTLATTDILQKGWAARTPLRFFINRENCPTNIDELLGAAMGIWNSVPYSSLVVQLGEDSATSPTTLLEGNATDVPLITCDSDFSSTLTLDGDLIAGVGFLRGSSFRPITNGGLILNVEEGKEANITQLDEIQTKVVIAHEIGHVLGLGHSAYTESLMYFSVGSKQNLALSLDDQNGVSFLYPRDELKNLELFGGCGAVRNTKSSGDWWNGNSLLLFVLLYKLFLLTKYLTKKLSQNAIF